MKITEEIDAMRTIGVSPVESVGSRECLPQS